MTIQQLEYIVALDKEKNFVRAANSCRVTQPTLTMQVQKLEDEIGFKIFDRSKKPLAVTSLGKPFIERAYRIINEVNGIKLMVMNEIESITGEFRLGIIPTLAPYLIPLFLPTMLKKHPDTHLVIEELISEDIITKLKNNQLDLGILATPLNEPTIREVPIFSEPFLLYLPVNDPLLKLDAITPEQLHPERMLLLSEGHCFREQALNLCEVQQRDPRFTYNSGSIEAIKGLVDQKVGYSLVPELSVRNEMKTKPSIRRFTNPEPSREISLVCHSTFSREKLIEVLRDGIQESLPDTMKKSRKYIRVKWR